MSASEWETLRLRLAEWQLEHFGRPSERLLTLGALEEVGELAHAVLKHEQRIRGLGDDAAFLAAASDAIGDVWVYTAQAVTASAKRTGLEPGVTMDVRGERIAVGLGKLALATARMVHSAERWGCLLDDADEVCRELCAVARRFGIDPAEAIRKTAESVLTRGKGHPAIPDPDDELDEAWDGGER